MAFPTSSSDFSPQQAMGLRTRCRSFAFLEHNGEPWTAFLVTYPESDRHWKGHFMFRSAMHAPDSGEIRTADLFVENSEEAIDMRARNLGRPMLEALLSSALHTQQTRSLQELKKLYEAYRSDQVSHFIALVHPDDFKVFVEKMLEGRQIDFRARDRIQLSMIVVQEIQRMLPLPPFEVWMDDYLAHRSEYERYAHQLHNGELP